MPVLSLWLYLAAGGARVRLVDFSHLWEKKNWICRSQQIIRLPFFSFFFLICLFFFFFLNSFWALFLSLSAKSKSKSFGSLDGSYGLCYPFAVWSEARARGPAHTLKHSVPNVVFWDWLSVFTYKPCGSWQGSSFPSPLDVSHAQWS